MSVPVPLYFFDTDIKYLCAYHYNQSARVYCHCCSYQLSVIWNYWQRAVYYIRACVCMCVKDIFFICDIILKKKVFQFFPFLPSLMVGCRRLRAARCFFYFPCWSSCSKLDPPPPCIVFSTAIRSEKDIYIGKGFTRLSFSPSAWKKKKRQNYVNSNDLWAWCPADRQWFGVIGRASSTTRFPIIVSKTNAYGTYYYYTDEIEY